MAIFNNNASLPGGLLRGVTETNVQSPTQAAGFSPAQADLIQEPLSRVAPQGTSQIVANKGELSLENLEQVLQQMPVPDPASAARIIAALVSQPKAQGQGKTINASQGQNKYSGPLPDSQYRGPINNIPQGILRAIPSRVGKQVVTSPQGLASGFLRAILQDLGIFGNK